MRLKGTLELLTSIAICQGVGVSGSVFTAPAVDSQWYRELEKPPFNPPGAVFGPVWTALYALMGIAAYLVFRSNSPRRGRALGVFGLQLALNFLWTIIFFACRRPGWAFVELLLLVAAIIATIVLFARISKTAAVLLLPYLAWTVFAAVLNGSIWVLNR